MLVESEREIVAACQRGEAEAFRELFETYKDKVYSIALRYSGNSTVAMDIAQDTFLKLFSSIRDFRGDSSFETWVYRMVVNSCFDHKRKFGRLIPLADEILASLRSSGDSLAEVLRAELSARIRSAVDRLAPDLRIAIILRYTEGLSYAEIAEVLGCSAGTVASRLNRGYKALERRLAHLAGRNGGENA